MTKVESHDKIIIAEKSQDKVSFHIKRISSSKSDYCPQSQDKENKNVCCFHFKLKNCDTPLPVLRQANIPECRKSKNVSQNTKRRPA